MPGSLRIAVLLASWCQLRAAEIRGLERRDVDLLLEHAESSGLQTTFWGVPRSVGRRPTQGFASCDSPSPNPELSHHLVTYAGPTRWQAVSSRAGDENRTRVLSLRDC